MDGKLDRVRVYIADTGVLESDTLFQELYQTIPKYRKTKIDRLKVWKERKLSLGAWLLLRKGLDELGLNDRKMKLCYGENGKPFFQEYPELCFSLSHSGKVVMCAISAQSVGCDVEKVRQQKTEVAKRFFHQQEYHYLLSQKAAEDRQETFYRLWTLKESFMKATGLGMKLPLSDFCIKLEGKQIQVEQRVDRGQNYYFKEFFWQEGYRYACCSVIPDWEENLRVVDFSRIREVLHFKHTKY